MGEMEIKYRVYYKQNHKGVTFDGFWCSDAYSDVDDARLVLDVKRKQEGFIEGHIKQEVTTKIIVE